MLIKERNWVICGEFNTAEDALKEIPLLKPDLVITDISMPGMSGVELTRKLKNEFPEIKVLVLSMHNEREIISEILLSEAEGYVLKNSGKKDFISAIHNILNGDTYFSSEVLKIMTDRVRKQARQEEVTAQLTDREMEIINLIVREFTTSEIAEKLFISPRTVDSHRKNILVKTNSKTIVGLMKYAFRNGLVT